MNNRNINLTFVTDNLNFPSTLLSSPKEREKKWLSWWRIKLKIAHIPRNDLNSSFRWYPFRWHHSKIPLCQVSITVDRHLNPPFAPPTFFFINCQRKKSLATFLSLSVLIRKRTLEMFLSYVISRSRFLVPNLQVIFSP